jgi:Multiubiquitin
MEKTEAFEQQHPSVDQREGEGRDKMTTIIVNTREKEVEGKEVTYAQIVALAFENPPTGEFIEITIAYRDGPGPDGTMQLGGSVRIKKDMIFDVTATDKS